MILRGKEIEHHNIIGDMMMKNHVIYKPMMTDGFPRDIDVKITSSVPIVSCIVMIP